MMERTLLVAALLLIAGCSAAPSREADAARTDLARTDLPPHHVATLASTPHERVRWGGMIVEVRNRETSSEIEVLAYPLDRKHRPLLKAPTEGRFIAVMPGYVERYDWPQGRFVTLHGTITGTREGLIDEKLYVYPVLTAEGSHLWPAGYQNRGPRFSFGIGIIR